MKELDCNPKIQKIINCLLAEEWIASQIYLLTLGGFELKEVKMVSNMFMDIYEDELNDHFKSIWTWAKTHGYTVPITVDDMFKYTGEDMLKVFKSIKKNKDGIFYLTAAVQSEKAAVKSYAKILKEKVLSEGEFIELKEIILSNFYDEQEHLQDLTFLLTSFEVVGPF